MKNAFKNSINLDTFEKIIWLERYVASYRGWKTSAWGVLAEIPHLGDLENRVVEWWVAQFRLRVEELGKH